MKQRTRKQAHAKNTSKPALRCAQDCADLPIQAFRLPDDGATKWQSVCLKRRAVLQRLSLAANQNGRSICLSVERVSQSIGLSRATVFRILGDLRTLGLLNDEGKWHPKYHTRMRTIDVAQVLNCTKRAKQPSQITSEPSQINWEPSQINPDPTEVQTEVPYRSEESKQGCSTKSVEHDLSDDEKVKSSDASSSSVVIPNEYFIPLVAVIADWIGDRDPARDYGAVRSLWAAAAGSPDERYRRVHECLEAGRDYAAASGTGIETLFAIAAMNLHPPSQDAGDWADGL